MTPRPGDLVLIPRRSIGFPPDSIALVVRQHAVDEPEPRRAFYEVDIVGLSPPRVRRRRYLEKDLEII